MRPRVGGAVSSASPKGVPAGVASLAAETLFDSEQLVVLGRPLAPGRCPGLDLAPEIVVHHAHTPATAPSKSAELPIPPALDRVILECLAKNPADRPQSARELSRKLAAIEGPRPWNEDLAREWWDMHRPSQKEPLPVASQAT